MKSTPELLVKCLYPDSILPRKAFETSAGLDICAYLKTETGRPNKRMISVRQTVMIPTGIAIRPPAGYVTLCCSRSGTAAKSILVANSPGVIDPDYTGEVKVLLFNGGFEPYYIEHEHRIAQLVIVPYPAVALRVVGSLPKTERADRGFGSTGK
jgi:dUTP pyrophosphatase